MTEPDSDPAPQRHDAADSNHAGESAAARDDVAESAAAVDKAGDSAATDDTEGAAADDAGGTSAGSDPPAAARPRKKKKRRRRERADEPPRPVSPSAVERPHFVESFPSEPKLNQLVAAFEAGDYRAVRRGAAELAESADDPEVRDAALELLGRIEPDPLVKYLLIASVALLIFLSFYAYSQQ